MNHKRIADYNKRMNRVCEYIAQNLDGDLSLEVLSEVAAFSKYHFHRLFSAHSGLSVNKFIQLSRLKRASYRVAFKQDMRIIDIALEAGFESAEAFSRAFRRELGQSPTEFMSCPDWPFWHTKFQFNLLVKERGAEMKDVDIVNFEETKVAMYEHCGDPKRVLDSAAKFIAWRKATKLSPVNSSRTFGIPHSDPKTTEPESFRFDICGSVDAEIPNNEFGVINATIPGGRCARVRHYGAHENLDDSVYYLYRDWLPESGEECRDFPCFFQYLNFIHDVDECDLMTDIFLPLK